MKIKKIVSLLLCLTIFSTNLLTVNASGLSMELLTEKQNDAEAYLIEMEQYLIRKPDGTLFIDAPKSARRSQYYLVAQRALATTNSMIASGYLKADKNGAVSVTSDYVNYVAENYKKDTGSKDFTISKKDGTIMLDARSSISRASGVNKIVWTGLTFKLYLDSTNASKCAISAATIASVLAIFIPEPLVVKAIAVGLYIASGLIAYNNAEGTGVKISGIVLLVPIPRVTFYWISAQ